MVHSTQVVGQPRGPPDPSLPEAQCCSQPSTKHSGPARITWVNKNVIFLDTFELPAPFLVFPLPADVRGWSSGHLDVFELFVLAKALLPLALWHPLAP